MARLYDQIGRFFSNQFGVKDTSDASKVWAVSASGIAASSTVTYRPPPADKLGTANTNVVATEYGCGFYHQTLLTLTAVSVAVSDANVGGGTLIYTFPVGNITLLGGTSSIAPTTTTAIASTLNSGVTVSAGVGSVQTTTQASGTLATTEQDIISAHNITSSTTINVAAAAVKGKLSSTTLGHFDGPSTAIKAYMNLGVPTATDIDGDATVTITGTVLLTWIFTDTQ